MTLYCTRHATQLRLRVNASSDDAQVEAWECPHDRCTVEVRAVLQRPTLDEQMAQLASFLGDNFPDEFGSNRMEAVPTAMRLLARLRARRDLMVAIREHRLRDVRLAEEART